MDLNKMSLKLFLATFLYHIEYILGSDSLRFEENAAPTHPTEQGCQTGFCHIGDRCIPRGFIDDQNPCWICDPEVSTIAWTYRADTDCHPSDFPLDAWHLSLIVVGSVLLLTLLAVLASVRIKQQLAKRQRVYPMHFVDVPHDKPLLKHMQ